MLFKVSINMLILEWTLAAAAKTVFRLVLVSAGIELIFFLVADIVLCFGFRMRIMLITHQSFSCC